MFDSVSYAKLIHRLRNYCTGGPLLLWISTFLSDRSHCRPTRVGNTDSATVALISGLIQGSGIGPMLFAMFINELAEALLSFGVTVKLKYFQMTLKFTSN